MVLCLQRLPAVPEESKESESAQDTAASLLLGAGRDVFVQVCMRMVFFCLT